jgi:hypothetical protein
MAGLHAFADEQGAIKEMRRVVPGLGPPQDARLLPSFAKVFVDMRTKGIY